MNDVSTPARPRRQGRKARRHARLHGPIVHLPTLVRNIPVLDLLDGERVELVHDTAMGIVERIGVEFRDDESIRLWREAGADVQGTRVRIPRELLMSLVATVPEEWDYHARNPDRTVRVGGRHMVFGPAYATPTVIDLDGVRRQATLADLETLIKLNHAIPSFHYNGGYNVEPMDVPVAHRHLHMVYTAARFSDKPFMGGVVSRAAAEDSIAMARIVFGAGFVEEHVVLAGIFNCNSPLVWDATMLESMRIYAENRQCMLCSPFVLYGASTPPHVVGGAAQLVAEALAGIALTQIIAPGSPAVFGLAPFGVSMKSGAPTYGSPEIALMMYVTGQMARHYRIPWRTLGMQSGSPSTDLYAGYDSILKAYPAVLAGCNWITHCGGTVEGSLALDLAKIPLDAEQMGNLYVMSRGLDFDDLDVVMRDLGDIGPGGHFLGTDYTRMHPAYLPELQDNERYDTWVASGSRDAVARGREGFRRLLAQYEDYKPSLDPAVDEELRAFVRRREAEIPSAFTP